MGKTNDMNRNEDNKNRDGHAEEKPTSAPASAGRSEDEDQHSYPGKLDQVEGEINNGEIGGGIQKQDDQKQSNHG